MVSIVKVGIAYTLVMLGGRVKGPAQETESMMRRGDRRKWPRVRYD